MRLSVKCDNKGNAFASLHMNLGVQCIGRRKQQPTLPTVYPPKSTHTQTEPINLSVAIGTDPPGLSASKKTESVGTQASETVESDASSSNTETVDDSTNSVVNNESTDATIVLKLNYQALVFLNQPKLNKQAKNTKFG